MLRLMPSTTLSLWFHLKHKTSLFVLTWIKLWNNSQILWMLKLLILKISLSTLLMGLSFLNVNILNTEIIFPSFFHWKEQIRMRSIHMLWILTRAFQLHTIMKKLTREVKRLTSNTILELAYLSILHSCWLILLTNYTKVSQVLKL